MMYRILFRIMPVIDVLVWPFVYLAALLMCLIRKIGVERCPMSKKMLLHVGVFPICDHYYDPLFNHKRLTKPLSDPRVLPGVDWNIEGQLSLLGSFRFAEELAGLPVDKIDDVTYCLNNGSFGSGDAEYWYNLIRLKKPRRIYEIGSGNSTLMARKAISRNLAEDSAYRCEHICIEPYEMAWLESTGVRVMREKVEDVAKSFFENLECNDILFIDSSHMIRPQGDVLYEYLEILPILKNGVIIHVHDIFSPRDYLSQWVIDKNYFWNEQYLLEAFLSDNSRFKVIGALNLLKHDHYDELKAKCLHLTKDREPGSFYLLAHEGPV
jgi:hypothetical protein